MPLIIGGSFEELEYLVFYMIPCVFIRATAIEYFGNRVLYRKCDWFIEELYKTFSMIT